MHGRRCVWEVRGVPICVERGVIVPMGCHEESRQRKDQWRGGGSKRGRDKGETRLLEEFFLSTAPPMSFLFNLLPPEH